LIVHAKSGMIGASMRELVWIGTSRDDLRAFPDDARDELGYALYWAQIGSKHWKAKPLRGFGGAGVLEVIADAEGDTYRAIYTVTLPDAVYVLHAFQKKAKHGIATPRYEIEMIRTRLKQAQALSARRRESTQGERP
jgi:phage-related protein